MKNHAKESERSLSTGTSAMASAKGSTISINGLLDCSVTLEKLDMHELNESNTSLAINPKHESPAKLPVESTTPVSSQQQEIKTAHSENMVVNVDIDSIETMAPINKDFTVADPNEIVDADVNMAPANEAVLNADHNDVIYCDAVSVEPELQTNYEQNQYFFQTDHFNEMFESSLRMNLDQNGFDAYDCKLNQDPVTTYSVASDVQVKQEKQHTEPYMLQQTLSNDSVIYEILDSDEEDALNARDSGRETNDTIIETDSSHIPTMGVLMMAKK